MCYVRVDPLRPEQNDRRFVDDSLNAIFLRKKMCISIEIC